MPEAFAAALWIWLAILTAGYARSRRRSAWTWFVLSLLIGPIAGCWIVLLPAPRRPDSA